MAVISLTITALSAEIVSGIPKTVSISANIPSTIFYTLDGSTPTLFSTIYTGPISIPTDYPTVILNVFATNGTDSSPVITETYQPDFVDGDARYPHSGTSAPAQPCGTLGNFDPEPFGAPPIFANGQYLGPGAAGLTVDDPSLPQIPQGFDANGNPTNFTNGQDPYGIPTKSFGYLYSTANEEGEGIGTFPPHTVIRRPPPPEQSNMASPFFDPRAFVVIQDTTKPINPLLPLQINRMMFSLEDVEHVRSGNQLFNTGLDAPPVTGSLTRPQYNPVDNSMTYSYYDSTMNKWLFSKQPFNPKPTFINDYSSGMVFEGGAGSAKSRVIPWIVFGRGSYLY
jgi:hypothetical protein